MHAFIIRYKISEIIESLFLTNYHLNVATITGLASLACVVVSFDLGLVSDKSKLAIVYLYQMYKTTHSSCGLHSGIEVKQQRLVQVF